MKIPPIVLLFCSLCAAQISGVQGAIAGFKQNVPTQQVSFPLQNPPGGLDPNLAFLVLDNELVGGVPHLLLKTPSGPFSFNTVTDLSAIGAGSVTGSGTINSIPIWTSSTGLGNSSFSDNGSVVANLTEPIQDSVKGNSFGPVFAGPQSPGTNNGALVTQNYSTGPSNGTTLGVYHYQINQGASGGFCTASPICVLGDFYFNLGSGASGGTVGGIDLETQTDPATGTTVNEVDGIRDQTYLQGTASTNGNITRQNGILVQVGSTTGTGTIANSKDIDLAPGTFNGAGATNFYGLYVEPTALATGATNRTGIYVGDEGNNGSHATFYGIYIDAQTQPSAGTDYGLFINNAPVSLGTGPVTGANVPIVGALTTGGGTSDTVALVGMTSSGHCSLTATNASAATNIATTYVSAKTTNQITVTHTATASMTYDVLCTPN
jgi:hypothetical protein